MQNLHSHQKPPAPKPDTGEVAVEDETGLLRDVLRLLPAGVTVQDEDGRFILINDAAASQLGMAAGQPGEPGSKHLHERREAGLELLRAGREAVAEIGVAGNNGEQVLLASHRPVRIAGRNLLLSSSTDISEQKAVEDHLFRSA